MKAFEVVGSFVIDGANKVASQIKGVTKEADKSESELKSMGKSTDQAGKNFDKAGKKAESFSRNIKISAAQMRAFGSSVSSVGDRMSLMVTGPIAAAGTAVIALGKEFADKADGMLDMAAATGLSTDAIQQWNYVSNQAGTSTGIIADSITRLNRLMPQFEKGTGAAAEAVQALGLNSSEFSGQDPSKTMYQIIEGLQGIPDPAKRAEIGVQIFSKRWEQLAPIVDLGNESLREFMKTGLDFAHSNEELQKANSFRMGIQRLTAAFKFAKESLVIALMPVLTDELVPLLENTVIPAVITLIEVISTMAKVFGMLPGPIQSVIISLFAIVSALGPVLSIGGRLIVLLTKIPGAAALAASSMKALGVAMTLATGPIGVAIMAISSVLFVVIKEWEGFTQGAKRLWNNFKMWIERVFMSMGINIVNNISDLPRQLLNVFKKAGQGVMNWLRGFTDDIVKGFRNMLDKIPGINLKADTSGLEASMNQSRLPSFSNMSGGSNGRSSGGSVTNIDMRNSTIRNGDDLNDRIFRSAGAPVAGF